MLLHVLALALALALEQPVEAFSFSQPWTVRNMGRGLLVATGAPLAGELPFSYPLPGLA